MRKILWIILGTIIAIFLMLKLSTGLITDWMWFKSLGFSSVFTTSLITSAIARLLAIAITFVFIYINLRIALGYTQRLPSDQANFFTDMGKGYLHGWVGIGSFFMALMVGSLGLSDWRVIQTFLHAVTTGINDPILGLDVGHYLFRLPVLQALNSSVKSIILITLLLTGVIYFVFKAFWGRGLQIVIWGPAKTHLSVLVMLLLGLKAWGYILSKQALLFTPTGLITGVDYTAANARFFAYNSLTVLAIVCIFILIIGIFRKGIVLPVGAIAGLVIASIILGSIVPVWIERFVVRPNQFLLEEPYLAKHIQSTREAYGLDKIVQKSFPIHTEATLPDSEHPSLSNIRLWDYRAISKSYEQLQAIGPYYFFHNIDIDRYTINGRQQQVMLAARELDSNRLPANAQNWVNIHLAYTHGYGLAMNGVQETNPEGQPVFLIGNLPVEASPGLPQLTHPQIYFGETQDHYIIVPNKNGEFDYPTGTGQQITHYTGSDGIPLNSLWRRLLFALRYNDLNILLSGYLDENSKMVFNRKIHQRLTRLAPFLEFDPDPYLVLDNGRLFWIVDAYTTSSYYPYAERHPTGVNYIRNPVKAVVDAYNGTVQLYIVHPEPIILTWQKIFPELFQPIEAMPAGLRSHIRYPEKLFSVQRDILRAYNMTSPKTFYEKEDYWDLPTEVYIEREQAMEPYYVTMTLPGSDQGEFVLFTPFTPRNKKNMSAWLAARSDGINYGELHLYTLPKTKLIYGPYQIEGRIAQNPEVSKLITLWSQSQSQVLRGNLLVIPLDGDFLYVEPFYIQSTQAQQPELKQVVMVWKERIALGNTFEEALSQLTQIKTPKRAENRPIESPETLPNRFQEILRLIRENTRKQEALFRQQQQLIQELEQTVEP